VRWDVGLSSLLCKKKVWVINSSYFSKGVNAVLALQKFIPDSLISSSEKGGGDGDDPSTTSTFLESQPSYNEWKGVCEF
jgi:hypothetical protein